MLGSDLAVASNVNDRAASLIALRGLLAEKYPACELKPAGVLATGLPAFDDAEGGLRRGAMTELVGPLSGGALFVEAMLAVLVRESCFAALVDTGCGFDPQGAESPALARLLWVRCADPMRAVKVADLLLRDGNLPLILLDLQLAPRREVCRIPASTWHRFQRLVEPTQTAFVVLTNQPAIEGAKVRILLRQRWTLTALRERRWRLLDRLSAQFFTRRQFPSAAEHERKSA
jgi:hypothetical protein